MAWDNAQAFPGNFYGIIHGEGHPYLGDRHHEGEAYGAAIVGGVMAVVVNVVTLHWVIQFWILPSLSFFFSLFLLILFL